MPSYISFTIDIDRDVNVPLKNYVKAFSFPAEKKQVRFSSSQKGFLLLMEILEKLNVSATLFFEGKTAEVFTKGLDFETGEHKFSKKLNSKITNEQKTISEKLNLKSLTKNHEIASHGYEHEDFLGVESGIILSKKQKKEIVRKSLKTLNQIFGREVKGFRAPYCRIDKDLIDILAELKFSYDSSMIKKYFISGKVVPFFAKGNENGIAEFPIQNLKHKKLQKNEILEFPIPTFKNHKKTSLYLWQMHEGKRNSEQYIKLIKNVLKERERKTEKHTKSMKNKEENEILILATHPWHLCENFAKGILSEKEIEKNVKGIEKILKEVKKMDVEFVKLEECLLN